MWLNSNQYKGPCATCGFETLTQRLVEGGWWCNAGAGHYVDRDSLPFNEYDPRPAKPETPASKIAIVFSSPAQTTPVVPKSETSWFKSLSPWRKSVILTSETKTSKT